MEWRQLEYFRKTAELEHISKAAEYLHLTQPSLTIAIRKLEDELGVELFERRGRNVVLNDFGKLFLDRVNSIFETMEQTKADLAELRTQLRGRVALMLPPPLYNSNLKDMLDAIVPHVSMEPLRFAFQPGAMLLDGTLDMCIITPAIRDAAVSTLPLVAEKSVVLMSSENRLSGREKLTLSELRHENFVSYRQNIPARIRLESSCRRLGFSPRVVFEGGTLRDMLPSLHGNENVAIISAFALPLYNLSGLSAVPLAEGEMLDSVMELCWLTASEKDIFVQPIAETVRSFLAENFSA